MEITDVVQKRRKICGKLTACFLSLKDIAYYSDPTTNLVTIYPSTIWLFRLGSGEISEHVFSIPWNYREG